MFQTQKSNANKINCTNLEQQNCVGQVGSLNLRDSFKWHILEHDFFVVQTITLSWSCSTLYKPKTRKQFNAIRTPSNKTKQISDLPARPARWVAATRLIRTTSRDSIPVDGWNCFCLTKPGSITNTTPSLTTITTKQAKEDENISKPTNMNKQQNKQSILELTPSKKSRKCWLQKPLSDNQAVPLETTFVEHQLARLHTKAE